MLQPPENCDYYCHVIVISIRFYCFKPNCRSQTSLQSINDFKSSYQHLQQIEKCKDTSITSTVPDEGTIDTSTILTPLRLQTM